MLLSSERGELARTSTEAGEGESVNVRVSGGLWVLYEFVVNKLN